MMLYNMGTLFKIKSEMLTYIVYFMHNTQLNSLAEICTMQSSGDAYRVRMKSPSAKLEFH
jgi:hypothetical protein